MMFAALFAAVANAAYTFVENVSLTASQTVEYNVAEGDVVEIGALSGGGGTLKKTGAGTLRINVVTTVHPTVDHREGRLAFGVSDGDYSTALTALSGAWFHVDASKADTMTVVSENGTNFVTRWTDVRPTAGVYATPWEVGESENWRAVGARPFLREAAQNGRPVVDFGPFANSAFVDGSGKALGYGAAMNWSEGCSSLYEVFIVVADTEDVKTAKTKVQVYIASRGKVKKLWKEVCLERKR